MEEGGREGRGEKEGEGERGMEGREGRREGGMQKGWREGMGRDRLKGGMEGWRK